MTTGATETAILESKQYIGGEWVGVDSGTTFEDTDPSTGEVVARVPAGSGAGARSAIEAAAAFPAWSKTPPAAAIEVVDTSEQATEGANATAYGLAARILTSDPDRGLALAESLESGIVHVNDQPVHDELQMPFGGAEDGGWGRFGGTAAIDEFTEHLGHGAERNAAVPVLREEPWLGSSF